MTVQDLIDMLEQCGPGSQVRLAIQPSWPFEHSINSVEEVFTDSDEAHVVYIAEGSQMGYLPGEARNALGWR